jgi:hypothetical protein
MATTNDLSGNFPLSLPSGVDRKLSKYSRANTGAPTGLLTPQFPGEIVLDTTNAQLYAATGPGIDNWTPVFITV